MEPKAFSVRLVGMGPWICALFLAFLPAWASAGTFQLNASADHTELELGDTLQFTLNLTVDGSIMFQPTVSTPTLVPPPTWPAPGGRAADGARWRSATPTRTP